MIGKTRVKRKLLWCLVIISIGLGGAKRLGDGGGFRVIVWGWTSNKGGTNFYVGEMTLLCPIGFSDYYYVLTPS